MKHFLYLSILALSLTFPAHAMEKAKPQSISDEFKEIHSLISKTIAGITKSSFSRTQKQTLHSQLSIVQKQHDTVTTSIEKKEHCDTSSKMSTAQLEAILRGLQRVALEKYKENLRSIEEVEKDDKKFYFFDPNDQSLQELKTALNRGIQIHERILADQSDY
jgi:hypothetical protein